MVTGGPITETSLSEGGMPGPMRSGLMRGGTSQQMGPGDIAIIPKGVPHPWSEITSDTIGYLVFRMDPDKVMDLK